MRDNTHFSDIGAGAMTRLAVGGIRELNLGPAGHLKRADAATSQR